MTLSPIHRFLRHQTRLVIWLAACVGLSPAPAHADDAGPSRQLAEVAVKHVTRACFTSLVHASGYLVPKATAVVMFNAPGYQIAEIRVKVGDVIKRGEAVARVEPLPSTAAGPSTDKPGHSSGLSLTSLAAGTVVQIDTFVGMPTSQTSKPLFVIAADSVVEAAVSVPNVYVSELKVGQHAHISMGGAASIDAQVRRAPAIIDPATQMGTARLSLSPDLHLETSRFVVATIEAKRSCGLSVPVAALRRTSSGASVQILRDDAIETRIVSLGLTDGTDSEVTAGLVEGDVIVASAGASREGDRVIPIFVDPQDAP